MFVSHIFTIHAYSASSSLSLTSGVDDTPPPPLPPPASDNPPPDDHTERPMDEDQQPGPSSQAPTDTPAASRPTTTTAPQEEPSAAKDKAIRDQQAKLFILQSLSLQLELEELWGTLSECLNSLEETKDPHAVLVLQPTVEAFFLVHADRSEEAKVSTKRQRALRGRGGRLSSFHTISDTESNPASPAPHLDMSPLPGTPGPSEPDADPYAHLPPDTARFLKFAGESLANRRYTTRTLGLCKVAYLTRRMPPA